MEHTPRGVFRLPALWAWVSISAAVLAAAGSIPGLVAPGRLFGQQTPELVIAVLAQDLVNLVLVAPLMLILALGARAGSLSSRLCLIGSLAFTVYNYAIYAFIIYFGPLFLLWITVFALATLALAGNLATLNTPAMRARLADTGARLPGWFLIAVAAVFVLLWLSEIVPDLLSGEGSTRATGWGAPTNPVHVLDLAFFLPMIGAVGVLLLRGHPIGLVAAPGALVWVILTSLPIVSTPFVTRAKGDIPEWSVMVPIGILALVAFMILVHLLRALKQPPTTPCG